VSCGATCSPDRSATAVRPVISIDAHLSRAVIAIDRSPRHRNVQSFWHDLYRSCNRFFTRNSHSFTAAKTVLQSQVLCMQGFRSIEGLCGSYGLSRRYGVCNMGRLL